MELRSTLFPGKTQPLNQKMAKSNRTKIADVSKTAAKEPTIPRQNRFFGTVRNTNTTIKNVGNNPLNKPSTRVPKKQPKLSNPTPLPTQRATNQETNETSKRTSPEKEKLKLKKKGICFLKQENILQEENVNVVSPKTPMASPSLNRSSKTIGTPYHTAEKCNKCSFDRLETASYWVGQIKLAESVGKHFVSAAFFSLAFESKAEPIRNLSIELKRYLGKHGYLSTQNEWRNVSLIYKLSKEEENAQGKISCIEEACTSNNYTLCCDTQKEGNLVQEKSLEPPEINL